MKPFSNMEKYLPMNLMRFLWRAYSRAGFEVLDSMTKHRCFPHLPYYKIIYREGSSAKNPLYQTNWDIIFRRNIFSLFTTYIFYCCIFYLFYPGISSCVLSFFYCLCYGSRLINSSSSSFTVPHCR